MTSPRRSISKGNCFCNKGHSRTKIGTSNKNKPNKAIKASASTSTTAKALGKRPPATLSSLSTKGCKT